MDHIDQTQNITNDQLRNRAASAAASTVVDQVMDMIAVRPPERLPHAMHAAIAAAFCAGWDLALLAVNGTPPVPIDASAVTGDNAYKPNPAKVRRPPRYRRGKRGMVPLTVVN